MTLDRKYIITASLLGAALLVALALYPVSQARLISAGVDAYQNHIPLFGNRTISQTIDSPYPITGIGVIAVNMRHAETIPDVTVELYSPTEKKMIAVTSIPASSITDDRFARLRFSEPIMTQGLLEVRLRAEEATRENPIGIRIDPNASISPHTRTELGLPKPGSMAIEVFERVPTWQAILTAMGRHQNTWSKTVGAILLTSIAVICGMLLPLPKWNPKTKRIYKIVALTTLALIALISRLMIAPEFSGVSGGDPYNYLLIARSLSHFENPFNEGEKRLPGYPLILAPSVLSSHIDHHLLMRIVSSLSATGIVILIALLAKNIGLAWPVQFIAPLLIVWQKDFLATSLRPEPYTFFTLLLLATLVLFTQKKQSMWQEIVFGILLGWAAITRQEGFVVAAIFGIAWLVFRLQEKPFRVTRLSLSFVRTFLPALLIVSPFFINNAVQYGNPFFTQYFEGDRLQIVDSWPAFVDNIGSTWGVLGSSYRPDWDELERYSFTNPLILLGIISTIIVCTVFTFVPQKYKRLVAGTTAVLSVAFIITFTILSLTSKPSLASLFPPFLAGIVFAAWVPFLWHTKQKGALVFIILISQILIATWFHPFAKHYQQAYPLLGLMVAAAFFTHTRENNHPVSLKVAATKTGAALILLPLSWLMIWTYEDIHIMVDQQNANAAVDSVAYRAVRFALNQPGPHGFDQAYLPARFYFGNNGIYFYDDTSDTASEAKWLTDNSITTFVTTNEDQTFKTPHANWEKLTSFRAEGKDERLFESAVYRIHQP